MDEVRAEQQETQGAGPDDGTAAEAAKVEFDLGQTVRELGVPVTALFASTMILPLVGQILLYMNIGAVGRWFREWGSLGPWLFVLGFALTTGSAVLPTYALSGIAGYLFGFREGGMVAMAGVSGGALLGYGLAIVLARGKVMTVIERHPRARVIRKALVERGFMTETGVVMLIRFPTSPFALTNLTMGAARVNPLVYVVGTVVGIAPRTLLAAFIGHGIAVAGEQFSKDAMKANNHWMIPSIVATIVVMIILYQLFSQWSRAALRRMTESG